MTVYTRLDINSVTYPDATEVSLNRSAGNFNSTSSFVIAIPNDAGQYDSTFNLNEEVEIWADKDSSPATTKLFTGIIEDIAFKGKPNKEIIVLSGRDYGAILQDVLVTPRIFKNQEVSGIFTTILIQNLNGMGITWNSVNITATSVDKITFNNISVFDALNQLAELSGFYFYMDELKDIHFIDKDTVSSGLTFDNTNITDASFKTSDSDIYNNVTMFGDRQLTGAQEIFTITTGSIFELDNKPSNVVMTMSGTPNLILTPGGILNVDNPAEDDVKWLVSYEDKQVISTSGIVGGDNIYPAGSIMIIDYQRSTPLVSIKEDTASILAYGTKQKTIVDRNIKDIDEANLKAVSFLAEHKDPKIEGKLSLYDVLNVVPGTTAVVDVPFHGIVTQTYGIINAKYDFNKLNNRSNSVLSVTVNKRIFDLIDYMKQQELRLRNLEGAEVDTTITTVLSNSDNINIVSSGLVIATSIGSGFYFEHPGHNQLNSPTATLGDMRGGSVVAELA